jgi:hypothetical protein
LPTIASPTPQALPTPPTEALAETPQGAAAFTRYYIGLISEGFRAGDATAVRAFSDPGCGGCNNFIGAIEDEVPDGERVEGGDLSVAFAESPPIQGGDVVVTLRYAIDEIRVLNAGGDVLRVTPAEPAIDAEMRLVRRDGGWVVMGFRGRE